MKNGIIIDGKEYALVKTYQDYACVECDFVKYCSNFSDGFACELFDPVTFYDGPKCRFHFKLIS